jgi:transposase
LRTVQRELHWSAMNQLNVNLKQSIQLLSARGWSRRRIARELGVHRDTVARYVAPAKPAIPTAGSAGTDDSKPAISTPGSDDVATAAKPAIATAGCRAGRRSLCEPHHAVIEVALQAGLSAQRIHQDLVSEHGFMGSYEAVKRYARQLGATVAPPFRRMECAPGEELQVDFGLGAWIEEGGKRRRPHLFRAVLSHSRKAYSEVVWRQTTEAFLRCLENAFRHLGGVTRSVVVDNLKAAVLHADWFDPELNPKLLSFAQHYGTVILPTKPAMPRHKGKVEAGVKYAQNNAVKGRRFPSLAAQNLFLSEWERTVADTRIHGTVRQQVGTFFTTVELPALQALPTSLFPSFEEVRRTVHRDGHLEYQRTYYSAPPEYVGREVWVRAESGLVRIFNLRMQPLIVHARAERGRFVTADAHVPDCKRHPVERGTEYSLQRCRVVGPNVSAWAEAMIAHRGPYGLRVLQGLLQLARKHPVEQLERVAAQAVQRGTWRLRDLRRLLAGGDDVIQLEFLQAHPLIRDLGAYRVAAFSS